MKDLVSQDDKKVVAALDKADASGDINTVQPLLHAFRVRKEDSIRDRMRTMLSSIKISDAERVFVEELENAESEVIHADILGFIWSSGFDPSEKLDVISRIATNGDYRAAMEGLTIIELCEGVENEQILLEATLNLRTAIDACKDDTLKAMYQPMLEALLLLDK